MRYVCLVGLLCLWPLSARAQAVAPAMHPQAVSPASQAAERPVYLVYYWRARPGKAADYAQYIRTVAEPIDEGARKAASSRRCAPTRPRWSLARRAPTGRTCASSA
jgi:hypothetical protein